MPVFDRRIQISVSVYWFPLFFSYLRYTRIQLPCIPISQLLRPNLWSYNHAGISQSTCNQVLLKYHAKEKLDLLYGILSPSSLLVCLYGLLAIVGFERKLWEIGAARKRQRQCVHVDVCFVCIDHALATSVYSVNCKR